MSLRTRVTVLVAACVAGAVALVSLGAFVTVRNSLYSKLQEQLMTKALAVAQAGPSGFGDRMTIDTGAFKFRAVWSGGPRRTSRPA
jgi:two-component system sensor histidine kinase MprB